MLVINISTFLTYVPFGTEEYYNYDLREPKRKIINPDKIREAEHEKDSTSYTINKGEMMHLCLRHKNNEKTLHDENLLMFVIIHELAHIMSKTIGHNNEFYDNFKFLLKEASLSNIYIPVNFEQNPAKYCGIDVTNNPLF